MQIEKNKRVSIDYTLKDENGEILDSSENGTPLEYVHGYGNLIYGLEKELEGKQAGDRFSLSVAPAEAYGEYSQDLVVTLPKSNFESNADITVGMKFEAGSGLHNRVVTVTKVDGDNITVDANHELAGKTLFFDVTVNGVRDASDEEINECIGGCSCGSCSSGCGGSDGGCSSGCCGCGF